MAQIFEISRVKGQSGSRGKKFLRGRWVYTGLRHFNGATTGLQLYTEANPVEFDMEWLKKIFVWWRGATMGTLVTTWWSGQFVGEDEFGNRYYQNRNGSRRWVLYNGLVEASRVPPDWHGWLHFTYNEPPTVAPFRVKPWEQPYVPNLTGTEHAYRPAGSLAATGRHAPATGDYEPWMPD